MTDDSEAAAGVGEELARARAALGYSLADVAQQLKFAPRQIEALEQERFEDLPAGTFARGMVRSYARLLKLDAEALVGRMAARVAAPDNAKAVASARHSIPITDEARRSNLIYAALSVAILGAIAAVVFEWQRERASAARLTFVAAAQAPLNEPGTVVAPNLSPLAAAAPVQRAEVSESPQPAHSAGPPAADRPEASLAGAGSVHQPARRTGAEGTRRIVMKFEREAWVQIRGGDGSTLFSQLNPAGSERRVEGKAPFALVIGNAQHVRLTYDDHQVDLAPHVKVEVARFTLE